MFLKHGLIYKDLIFEFRRKSNRLKGFLWKASTLCECVDCASLVALGTLLETDGVKSGELREALQVISVVIAVCVCVCVGPGRSGRVM